MIELTPEEARIIMTALNLASHSDACVCSACVKSRDVFTMLSAKMKALGMCVCGHWLKDHWHGENCEAAECICLKFTPGGD